MRDRGGERGECGGGGECAPEGESAVGPEGASEVSAVVVVSAGRMERAR